MKFKQKKCIKLIIKTKELSSNIESIYAPLSQFWYFYICKFEMKMLICTIFRQYQKIVLRDIENNHCIASIQVTIQTLNYSKYTFAEMYQFRTLQMQMIFSTSKSY